MPERVYGDASTIPATATRTAVTMDSEIPLGGWLYIDSGIIMNKDGTNFFYTGLAEASRILNGDLSTFKNQIIEAFKQKEPQSTIEVTWLRVSYDEGRILNMQGGYFRNFRVQAVIKNVQAGLAPIIIAAILIAIPFIIAVTVLAATIAWVAFQIVESAKKMGDEWVIIVGLAVLGGLGALLFFLFGGSFSGGKKGVKIQGRR